MLYTKEFEKKLLRHYFLRRIRLTLQKVQERKEYRENHFCEKNLKTKEHNFDRYVPFLGCVKYVCTFCFKEEKRLSLKPSVHSSKGKSFSGHRFGGRMKTERKSRAPRKPKPKPPEEEKNPRTASQIEWDDDYIK